ncbi:hypothetical protein ES332_D08G056700v1 [Gossypium tomentosum]|uniref:Leucine-rich repeat-containing N-terminal plant-type domain-containing protein n=2 Tax=Gossypium TaxID=3633 RepID=A0A5D2JQ88_GOSTO|nr:hypothetical protein ES332_D08G056700v1 [Gossypium tomentosum]
MEAKSLWVLLTTLLFIIQGWRQTEGCLEQERIALFQLKSFFNRLYKLENWADVKGSNCCQWERVECNITSKRVIGLDLYFTRYWDNRERRSDLSGYLNVSLFLPFEELKSLNLSENNIADLVDNQVSLSSVFNNLEILVLSGNNFNDSVLSKLKSLTKLKTLDLSDNRIISLRHFEGEKVQPMMNLEVLDLSGNLLKNNDLTYLKGLSSLKSLNIGGNQLEGSIDIRVLNNLTKLKLLDLSDNKIESLQSSHDGERPLNVTNFEELYLDSNSFTNSLLAQLNGFSNLKSLSIRGNQLNGSINIKVLNNLTRLKTLDLSDNKIESLQSPHDGERPFNLTNLEELYLDSNSFANSLLAQLSGFSNLKSLNIRNNQLKGSINIKDLNALSNLEKLDMSNNEVKEFVPTKNKENESLEKLKVATLNNVFINGTVSLMQLLETFSSVNTLYLRDNHFNDTISTQDQLHVSSKIEELVLDGSYINNNILQGIGVLASLKILSLRGCGLSGTLSTQGWCDLWKLEVLDLGENAIEGTLPPCLANLSSLDYLDISDNQFTGKGASTALANLTLLRFISLSQNLFEVPSIFISFANHSHLKFLFSDQNKLVKEPTIQTWVPKFQLKVFRLWNCATKELHIEIPKFLYYQNDLSFIDLSDNNFGGNPFWLLENNTRMGAFLMKGNSFMGHFNIPSHLNPNMSIVDISDNKIQGPIPANICSVFPQLARLNLSSNFLQGNIPPCLGNLKTMLMIDLSHNQLYGGIPEMSAQSDSLMFLRLSNNHLSGKISPTIFCSSSLQFLYLDGNKFDGNIPSIDISTFPYYSLSDIDLSNNNLSGELPRWIWNVSNLQTLAVSNNQLKGLIPMELCYLVSLEFLDLSKNNFFGPIPSCFHAQSIKHLHLSRNRLSGTLTNAFFNSSSLVTLDLSENQLTGEIPYKIGTLSALSVLLLKANYFVGEIPIDICKLYSLNIIDLSQNKLSGLIPSCLSHLTFEPSGGKSFTLDSTEVLGLVGIVDFGDFLRGANYFGITEFELFNFRVEEPFNLHASIHEQREEKVDYTTKRVSYTYKGNILEYMSGIDLSCNRLTGEIPREIGNLSEIRSLNLSHNNLTGHIPSTFSKLKQIESLDLSHNNLIGRIPVQLTELYALAVFNVSYNNLSGSIPSPKAQFGTFDESNYVANPFLCGSPLHKNCNDLDSPPTAAPNSSNKEEESGLMDKYVFWVTFFVSYVIVLLVIVLILYINPYWRQAWFSFVEHFIKTCQYFIEDNLIRFSIFKRSK